MEINKSALKCSFCGKLHGEVASMITAGPTDAPHTTICDECVLLCHDIVVEQKQDKAAFEPPVTEDKKTMTFDEFVKELRHQVDGAEGHLRNLRANTSNQNYMPDQTANGWLCFVLYDVANFSNNAEVAEAAQTALDLIRAHYNAKEKVDGNTVGVDVEARLQALETRVTKLEDERA